MIEIWYASESAQRQHSLEYRGCLGQWMRCRHKVAKEQRERGVTFNSEFVHVRSPGHSEDGSRLEAELPN